MVTERQYYIDTNTSKSEFTDQIQISRDDERGEKRRSALERHREIYKFDLVGAS